MYDEYDEREEDRVLDRDRLLLFFTSFAVSLVIYLKVCEPGKGNLVSVIFRMVTHCNTQLNGIPAY